MVFDRAPAGIDNGAWLMPVVVREPRGLLLTVLFWPVTAIVRRRFGARLELPHPAMRAYRVGKIGALLIVRGTACVGAVGRHRCSRTATNLMTGGIDPVLRFDQVFGFIAFIGGFRADAVESESRVDAAIVAGRRSCGAWCSCSSAFIVLWIAFVFNLISWGVNY